LLAFLLSKTRVADVVEVAIVPTEETVSTPQFEWALSPNEVKVLEQKIPVQNILDTDKIFLSLTILTLTLSPFIIVFLKVSLLSLVLGVLASIFVYSHHSAMPFSSLVSYFTNYPHKLTLLSNQKLKRLFSFSKQFIQKQDKQMVIYGLLAVDALYLDLFVAKFSLAASQASAYIFIATLVKLLTIGLFYILYKWLLEKNVFRYVILDKRVNTIFLFVGAAITYLFFFWSKIFVKVFSLGIFTSYHQSLPYILATHLVLMLIFMIVAYNKDYLKAQSSLTNFILQFLISLHLVAIGLLIFFNTSSLEAVAFFTAGIALFLLTLLYHLFYKLHIYSQLI
jgi:hypothetical protein